MIMIINKAAHRNNSADKWWRVWKWRNGENEAAIMKMIINNYQQCGVAMTNMAVSNDVCNHIVMTSVMVSNNNDGNSSGWRSNEKW